MKRNKKLLVSFLLVMTLVLAGISVYVGIQVTKEQAPEDSDAASDGCNINYNGNSSFTLSGEACASGKIAVYEGDSCPTTDERVEYKNANTSETYGPSPSSGKCEQVDYQPANDPSNGGGGVCECSDECEGDSCEPELRVCGQTCSSTADCRQDLGPVTCATSGPNAGKCVNTLCPNDTQGASCGCNDIENSCGERCGIAYGLCEDGYSCTYAEPTCNWSTSTPIAYCLPSDEENLGTGYTYTQCTQNDTANSYLTKGTKKSGFSQAELDAACTPFVEPVCGDGVVQSPEQCDDGNTNNNDSCSNTCTTQTIAECVSLTELGPDPVVSADGSVLQYTFKYKSSAAGDPFPNIRLRVGPSSGYVGRNNNSTSSSLVAPISFLSDPVLGTKTYVFQWEAFSTGGSAIPAGSYDVRVLLQGTEASLVSTAACQESVTINQTVEQEPVFSLVKSAAEVCDVSGNSVVTYTITVRNIGPVTGIIDSIVDTYDPLIDSQAFTLTNISPSTGVKSGGKITWTGTEAERTFTAGQSKTYTYKVTIPAAKVNSLASTGLLNTVTLQYDTPTVDDNTISFEWREMVDCTDDSLPATGLSDSNIKYIVLALGMLILAGAVYKFKLGEGLMRNLGIKLYVGNPVTRYEDKVELKVDIKRRKRTNK